jgi:hypothetical protein
VNVKDRTVTGHGLRMKIVHNDNNATRASNVI